MSNSPKSQILRTNYQRFIDSDIWYSFKKSPVTVISAIVTFLFFFVTIFAPFIAPHDPFDLASIDLMDASLPPAWFVDGETRFCDTRLRLYRPRGAIVVPDGYPAQLGATQTRPRQRDFGGPDGGRLPGLGQLAQRRLPVEPTRSG